MADPPDPPRYRAIQIDGPDPSDTTQAHGINNLGQVVGRMRASGVSNPRRGFLWLPDHDYGLTAAAEPHLLIAAGNGAFGTVAFAINDNGRIAGWRGNSASVWPEALNIWDLHSYSGTGEIVGEEIEENVGERVGLNNNDVAIATRWVSCGISSCEQGFLVEWKSNGQHVFESLHPTESGFKTFGFTVGDSGLAAGLSLDHTCPEEDEISACIACGTCLVGGPGAWWPNPALSSVRLEPYGEYCELLSRLAERWPHDINNNDRIVGAGSEPAFYSPENPDCVFIATIWLSGDAPPLALPWPSGMSGHRTEAHSINDELTNEFVYVVGHNTDLEVALLWRVPIDKIGDGDPFDWEAFDLNAPGIVNLCETNFTVLREATGVNNMGWISGWGQWSDDGTIRTRGFVLVPVNGPDACLGDITGPLGVPNGQVGVPDMLELLSQWGDCPTDQCATCWADLDGNGTVGVPDLLILLENWGFCPGNPSEGAVLSLEQDLSNRGIGAQRWSDFLDVLAHDPKSEQDRWICWLERYLNGCTQCRPCRGMDPFAN